MFDRFKTTFAITIAGFLALTMPTLAGAQSLGDRDAKEVADYVLTDAALAKYTQAVRKLQPLMEQVSQDCGSEEDAKSLTQQAARMDGVPGVKSALEDAGMTSREYLLFTWSVFQNGMAAWMLEQPGGTLPPGVKMENVNFYRAHKAELEKLGELTGQTDCGDQ